ncbi:ankyrin, partial [Thozetella sp. PMI_491]
GNVEMVRVLIATERVDLNARHASGRRPIMWAIQNGSEEIVQALLSTGKVDLSQVYLGQNVLMMAIEYGQLSIAQLLLATGQIQINATDYQGRTALFYTAGPEGTWEITKWLLSVPGVQANALDLFGTTPFFQAVINGNTRSVSAFLNTEEVDVNHKNSTGETALMVAAISSNTPDGASAELIALLLQSSRIDVNAKDARGRTLL